ncbi:MAG: MGMT family protein, partial [Gemmatimonadota bacterium]|nr:MGMT family protein [Gemmatimonadota bacterium]
MQRFQVKSPVASVTVTTLDGTVKKITFGAKTKREPETRFEKKVAKELGEYFAGKRQEFTVPIELTGTEFQLNVWNALAKIPYGETKSYGEIAKRVKCPGGARA